MGKFVGFYDNGTYRVGCSGATMYVFNQNDEELARFRDLNYAYYGAFQPGSDVFVLKSVEGAIAVYDLNRMALIRKFVVSRKRSQDGGFAFSPDGAHFYNIESMDENKGNRLAVYRCPEFELENAYFEDDASLLLNSVEFGRDMNDCYLLGCRRMEEENRDFIAHFAEGRICEERQIADRRHAMWLYACKVWQNSGFTTKSREFLCFEILGEPCRISLKEEYEKL